MDYRLTLTIVAPDDADALAAKDTAEITLAENLPEGWEVYDVKVLA